MNNPMSQRMITDSQNRPLAHALLESSQTDQFWRVRVLDGQIRRVMKYKRIHLIAMEDFPSNANVSGRILRREGESCIIVQPDNVLDRNCRQNLRVPFRFDSFLYPVTGAWQGRLPMVCDNLSCGGIAFSCKAALEIGETVELVAPVTEPPLLLQARILRAWPPHAGSTRYSAQFAALVCGQEALLWRAIFSWQIRDRDRR